MPNWCANRLLVTGLAESVDKVRALMRGEVRPAYVRAEAQGIQLFLAGCAGLLRPVTDESYMPFPFLWIIDEVGAGYSEKLGELATQIRSLGYCLLLAGQEVQRLKTAAGDAVWTLIANMGTRITGIIRDPKDTLEILQLMAGTEYRAEMGAMVQNGGLMGGWSDDTRLQVREQKRVDVDEIQSLQEGENITLFRGQVIRGSSLYINDDDKFTRGGTY